MKKINRIEKIETKSNVNIFMNKPFISNNKKEHHESNKNFQDELNDSINDKPGYFTHIYDKPQN